METFELKRGKGQGRSAISRIGTRTILVARQLAQGQPVTMRHGS